MKKLIISLIAVVSTAMGFAASTLNPASISVMTYNIRMSWNAKGDGDNRWENRRHATVNMIEQEHPALIGMQEVCPDQVAYLDSCLTTYGRIGVGREDGIAEGEMMAILYDKERLDLEDWGTFWLSETPEKPSLGWDAACKRTCTWSRFHDRQSDLTFYHFNTHLDHIGPQARQQGILLIAERIKELVPEGTPFFVTADFNSDNNDPIFQPLKEIALDVRAAAPVSDSGATYNEWGNAADTIDHIFATGFIPMEFRVLRGDYGAPFISDHYPVMTIGFLRHD